MKRILFSRDIGRRDLRRTDTRAREGGEGGLLQGTCQDGLTVYRGIPFAAPPVGELRWRAPQPAAKWEGVKPADKFGARCYQGGRGAAGVDASEDCLYLNVWSPAKTASDQIPVLVSLCGGGCSAGATSQTYLLRGEAKKEGVVLVSIAYRVGQMGFFAHPELSAENRNHVSGNYGLLDMISGLQWVQRNIAAFGGDPHHVTIFGESAGGIAVSMLCASPLAKGLFQGAISQSGGSFGPPRPGATQPGENMKTTGGCGIVRRGIRQERGRRVHSGPAQDHGGQASGGRTRRRNVLADHRWLRDSGRPIQTLLERASSTTRRFWWATTRTRARPSRGRRRRRIISPP